MTTETGPKPIEELAYRFCRGEFMPCTLPDWFKEVWHDVNDVWPTGLEAKGVRSIDKFGTDGQVVEVFRAPDGSHMVEYFDGLETTAIVFADDGADFLMLLAQYVHPITSQIEAADRELEKQAALDAAVERGRESAGARSQGGFHGESPGQKYRDLFRQLTRGRPGSGETFIDESHRDMPALAPQVDGNLIRLNRPLRLRYENGKTVSIPGIPHPDGQTPEE